MKSKEILLNHNSEYLSQEGFENLQQELNELKNQRRQEIASRLEYAKSLGDLTENSEYHSAKEEQSLNESRIAELEDILARAVIVSKGKSAESEIQFGSKVSLEREEGERTEEYLLVGHEEADPSGGKISYESPLGRSIFGKKKGDKIEVITPKGKINYTIIDVE